MKLEAQLPAALDDLEGLLGLAELLIGTRHFVELACWREAYLFVVLAICAV